jgi:asparagine synthase (glutamine-hydrolysing)
MHELTNSLITLPDSPDGKSVLWRIPHENPTILTHPSGRPWLVGNWEPGSLVVADAGQVRIAVFGFCPITTTRLTALSRQVRGLSDLDTLTRALPGSAHLVASVHGQVRFQGTVTGTRQVFTTRLDGVPIACDRADVLALMIGARPDEDLLATAVTFAHFVTPLSERSWWTGVHSVPADSYVVLPAEGAARTVPWWTAPEPDIPLHVGATNVRDALSDAVIARIPAGGRLSADLSGGMDSTSLCFLAAEHTTDLLTFRWTEGSVLNDDPMYAAAAARLLRDAEHLELRGDDCPPVFAPPYDMPGIEAPQMMTRGTNRVRHSMRLLSAHGAAAHMTGHGGDELFTGSGAYLRTLIRREPLRALRALRVHRALGRWPLIPTLIDLMDTQDLAAWWREAADKITAPMPPRRGPSLGWALPVRATPWSTPEAIRRTRQELYRVADEVVLMAQDRGQHEAMTLLRTSGPSYRWLSRDYAAHGLRLDLPYLDDRVVEATLAVRPYERYTPWRFKPLLAEAMRGRVPELILARYTKGDYEEGVQRALQQHVPDLLDLFADSELAARGLIDVDALRTALRTPPHGDDDLTANLEATLGAEIWLREITAADRRATVLRAEHRRGGPVEAS